MRKNPLSNINVLFGPGRTFGKANIVTVPPVAAPVRNSPRVPGPGNVHDPFGALAPRKFGSETPPDQPLVKSGDHILFTRVLFDATNTSKQIGPVPFDIKTARVYGVAGGAHLFTSTSPASDLDQFGVPLDPSYVGTGLPNNDTIIPIPTIGVRELTLLSAFTAPAAFTGAQQQDGPVHLYLLNDGPTGQVLDYGSYPQTAQPSPTGIEYQQGSLIGTAPTAYSMYFDGTNTGSVKLPYTEPNGGNAFTLECLFSIPHTALGQQDLIANSDPYGANAGQNKGFALAADTQTGQFMFQFGCSNGGPKTALYNAAVATNTVYHLAVTFDPVNQLILVYVNGVATSQMTGFGSYIASALNMMLAQNPVNKSCTNVWLQNVAVYNYALTGPQLLAHYNALTDKPQAATPQECLVWITDDLWSPSTSQITPQAPSKVVQTSSEVALKPLAKAIGSGTASDTQVSTSPGELISVLVTSLAASPAAMKITDGNGGTVVGIIPSTAAVGNVYTFNMPVTAGVYVAGGTGNPGVTICFE